MNLKLLLAAAKAEGYTGADDDRPAIVAWLESKKVTHIQTSDGTKHEVKALVVDQPDENTVVVQWQEAAPAEAEAVPPVQQSADIDGLVAAKFEALLKEKGLSGNGRRPNLGPEVTVKSGEERRYENDIKTRKARFSSYGTAKAFAHHLGAVCAARIGETVKAGAHRSKFDLIAKDMVTTGAASGATLVHEMFDADMIKLVNEHGAARRLCRVVQMTDTSCTRPRSNGTLSVYYPDEGSAGTTSTATFSAVSLNARKGIVITKASREIIDDARIDIASDAAEDIARAIALVEDESLFNGTGVGGAGAAATYIPFVKGFTHTDNFGATATSDSRSVTGGDTSDAHTFQQLVSALALVPQFARSGMVWTGTPEVVTASLLHRSMTTVGGLTMAEFDNSEVPSFLGVPIVTNNVMNADLDTGGNVVDLMVGNFSLAADFGDRMSVEIDTSDQRYWDEANIGIRGLVRHDINIHDLGSTTTASPVVALFQT